MANADQLPHLMRLVDDDSDVVRTAVTRELAAFGADLEPELDQLCPPPSAETREMVRLLVADHIRNGLREAWGAWFYLDDELDRLESALSLIADFQSGTPIDPLPLSILDPGSHVGLSSLLDALAEEFYQRKEPVEAGTLASFLFGTKGIQGATDDYYGPQNSNLMYVIQARRGIPISLACVYMLVGRRLGLEIRGCNWPGHFIARTRVGDQMHVVDCYRGGRVIEQESFLKMQGPSREAALEVLESDAGTIVIVTRVLNNLIRAYQVAGNDANAQLMGDLLRDLERRAAASQQG